jgi:hypothetical protein
MRVRTVIPTLSLGALCVLPTAGLAQDEMAREDAAERQALIASAMSAAPDAVSADATIMDALGNVLVEGSNGYTCLADDPAIPGESPFCADAAWMAWVDALLSGETPPTPEAPAFLYALRGGWPASNVDPGASGPTDDNEWIGPPGPHIAVLVPDVAMLEGTPTAHDNGGPWIMWRDTPYVHLMIPTSKKE